MRSTKLVVLALLMGQGAVASSLTLTGFSQTVNSYGVQVVSNSVEAGSGMSENLVGMSWNGVLGARYPRTGGGGALYVDLWLSFRIDDIPVEVWNQSTASDGKLVNGGGSATNPHSNSQTLGLIYEVIDSNGDQAYTPGEQLYNVPYYTVQTNSTLVGNGYQYYTESDLRPDRYVLGARSIYVARLHHVLSASCAALSYEPTVTVTDEVFRESYVFQYQAVPEPASLAALAAGLAVLGRRRRR